LSDFQGELVWTCRRRAKLGSMQDTFDYCEALVRAADRDRFVATLFAPAEHRGPLFALYAFNIEIARVREVAREPLAGEIRLQWWHDVLAGVGRGEVEGNPVVAALRKVMTRYRLPAERLTALIEARRFDLYDEPMATLADLELYAQRTATGLMTLAGQILGAGAAAEDALVRHVGLAYAIAGLLKAFPVHAARGQVYVPIEILKRHGTDRGAVAAGQATPQLRAALAELRLVARCHLAEARTRMPAVPDDLIPALLPAAPVPTALARMERTSYDPFAPDETAPWRRQWLIWRAARRPARIFA
jgi:phytoene synthase